jgi:hypothetical protein
MKKFLLCFCLAAFLLSCNSDGDKTAATSSTNPDSTTTTAAIDLPYKASYSSSFSTDVSDADLKTAMLSYKYWSEGNMKDLESVLGDSITVEFNNGDHFSGIKADLVKRWTTYRDSLSSVKIDMLGWQKMYSTDKKEAFIVTWYEETDTYKNGKVDMGSYHDLNRMENGKIVWYSQYKRPMK